MKLTKRQIQHLYWRAGFGPDPYNLNNAVGKTSYELVDHLFKSSEKAEFLTMDFSKLEADRKSLSREEKKKLRKLANKMVYELDVMWLKQMVETKAILREKMAFFFHDHFAVRLKNPKYNLDLNNILRKHALGNFGDLLMEVSKSPAMIEFLNNKQNKKGSPNENFAREVMELFTLGRDNGYTETDIKEAARAFTGWSVAKGEFIFRSRLHDAESKTILGQMGNFNGEDVIQILLKEKQTARYLSEKIVDFLIGRTIPASAMNEFVDAFYDANYDLSVLIKAILTSEVFYAEETIACKIKSPTELLVGMTRLFEIEYREPKTIIQIQRKLNQVLFFPPNVAGWSGGRSWIDSSTLMLRLKLSSLLLNFGVIEWDEKGDDPEQKLIIIEKKRDKIQERTEKRINAHPNWKSFEKNMNGHEENLASFLIQAKLSEGAQATIDKSDSITLKDRAIELLSLPEYQLF
ncbi:MAG: DUF1800 family protein [Crocinitomicaceae bacterium]